jgi:hypothetical protein
LATALKASCYLYDNKGGLAPSPAC